jgi:hypothetical protein
MGSLNPNRSNLLKAHGRFSRQAVRSVPRTCRIHTIFMVRSTARAIQLSTSASSRANIQGLYNPEWHSSSDRINSKLTTWCPSKTNPTILILPLGVRPTASSGSCYHAMWQLLWTSCCRCMSCGGLQYELRLS